MPQPSPEWPIDNRNPKFAAHISAVSSEVRSQQQQSAGCDEWRNVQVKHGRLRSQVEALDGVLLVRIEHKPSAAGPQLKKDNLRESDSAYAGRFDGSQMSDSLYTHMSSHDRDYERYTQLNAELKLKEQTTPKLAEPAVTVQNEPQGGLGTSGYEEPWDLEIAQNEIEDQFDGVLVGEWIIREKPDQKVEGDGAQRSKGDGQQQASQSADIRPQDGYEKPWDWKPHRKDERTQEGYEKPWDWKPHQKDDRPPNEYEEPWDKKSKCVKGDVIAAKIAKETAKASLHDPSGSSGTPAKMSEDVRGLEGYDRPWDLKPHQKDSRPPNEYEEPWDKKAKDVESEVIAAKIAKETAKASMAAELINSAGHSPTPGINKSATPSSVIADKVAANRVREGVREGKQLKDVDQLRSVNHVVQPSPKLKRPDPTPDVKASPRFKTEDRIQAKVPLEDQRLVLT